MIACCCVTDKSGITAQKAAELLLEPVGELKRNDFDAGDVLEPPEPEPKEADQGYKLEIGLEPQAIEPTPEPNEESKPVPKEESAVDSLATKEIGLEMLVQRRASAKDANEFGISLATGQVKLGLSLDWKDGKVLEVSAVNDGLVAEWNAANPGKEMKTGDKIVVVNGVSGSTDQMLNQIKLLGEVDLVVLRQSQIVAPNVDNEFAASLVCSSGTLIGLACDFEDGQTLMIRTVGPGVVAKWNVANPGKRIVAGDRIMDVNGISGSTEKMLAELKRICA